MPRRPNSGPSDELSSALQKVSATNLKQDIVVQLTAAIIDGRFQPGQRLIETEIASKLGVSRGPVREAIQTLEAEGLVEVVPNRGAYVSDFTVTDVRELTSLRVVLEAFAVRMAIPQLTDRDIRRLERLVESMRSAGRDGNLLKLVQLDWDFHEMLFDKAGHGRLHRVLTGLHLQIRYFISCTDMLYSSLVYVADTHLPIIDALRKRDAGEAEKAVSLHIREVGERLEQTLGQRPSASGSRTGSL